MSVNKSVRYTFLGLIVTGHLLVPVSNVVYASENTINIYADSEKENSKNLVDSEKVLNFLFSKDIDEEYIGNFIDTNIEKISQVKDSLGLKEEVLLSLGAYYVVKNHDKFSSVDSETVPSILEGLKIVELEDLFNEEQSIEEQSKILQEHYQIEGLYDAIIELSYLYKELKIEEPVDVAVEGEEVDEVDETGETVEVEESKETEEEVEEKLQSETPEETENTSDLPEAEEKEEPQSESTEEEIESIPEQPEADKDTEEEQTPTEPAKIEEEIVAEENVVKTQKSMAPAMFSTMSIQTPNVPATKLHEVKAGDTLWSISVKYGVTVKNLQDWNELTTNFLRVGQTLGVNGKYNDAQVLFSTRQQFINTILPAAKQVAAEYNLYTSVLLAQAIHESNGGNSPLAKISNNIFGIKAMTSKFVEKPTWEQNSDGSKYEIMAKFEAYNTYYDAIVSYAQKIRNGVSWDPNRYKGAWPENTITYEDATKALTGTYATDLSYNTKLNNTIQTYNLTQYDTHVKTQDPLNTVFSTRDTDYSAKVTGSGHSIDTLPWGVPGYKTIGRSNQYVGQTVTVTQEKVTGRATWAYLDGIGWIDKKGLTPETITSTKDVHYMARVTRNWDSITTLPWGVEGYKTVARSADFLNQVVEVTKEAVTPRATWALISANGKELGWIDTKGLRHDINAILTTTNTDYSAKITAGHHSIDTLPWGVPGYRTVGRSRQYLGQTFRVTEERVNGRATWAYLEGLGWIDKAGITPESITSTKDTYYVAKVTRTWDSITTLPWGVPGYETIAKSSDYLGQTVAVSKEAVTPRATWAYISIDGKDFGWIDVKGLEKDINAIVSTQYTDYSAKITGANHSIDTLPWGVPGYRTVGRSRQYLGQTFRVTEERVNGRATWAYLEGLGWIDKAGITPETITSTQNVRYEAKITRTWDSITTLPWGVPGYETIAKSSDYLGQTVAVSKEAVTPRATWAYISIDGKDFGWIDVKGLEKDINAIVSTQYTDYSAKITGANHSIDTLPWGVPGYRTVGRSRQYLGQTFRVTEERVNGRATWAYLEGLGWIDKAGITPETITSTQNVRYEAKITRTWDSITTLPWGVEGFLTVGKSANYLGQTVEVSKEAVTPRATWAYITLNGQELGWIDKSGLEVQEERRVIFIDVGHGGTDPGAVYYGVNEKDINLTVSLKLQRELEKRGYVVIMSRTDDTAIDFKTERSKIANKTDSDVFISVHHNANPYVATANGIETFYYEYDPKYPSQINGEFHNDPYRIAESSKLAGSIHNSLVAATGLYDRGVKRDTFAVLRETRIPAVLLELGFMSNQSELNKLVNDIHQNKSVIGIADGIDAYFGN